MKTKIIIASILLGSVAIAGEFSFGVSCDLFYQSSNDYSWNSYRKIPNSQMVIETDTIHTIQLEDIMPALGVFIGYQKQLFKKVQFDLEYGFTTMRYDYSFSNGIGPANNSYMSWSRHTVDIGVSSVLFESERSKSSIGIGEALTFVSPFLNSIPISLEELEPGGSFFRNSLPLNDRRGEYLYIMYQNQLFSTRFDYQIKVQVNYIDATFIDWFAPTIRFGIIL